MEAFGGNIRSVLCGYKRRDLMLKIKISGRESQGACRQDELIGGKLQVVK
jgi:hypothetical protein